MHIGGHNIAIANGKIVLEVNARQLEMACGKVTLDRQNLLALLTMCGPPAPIKTDEAIRWLTRLTRQRSVLAAELADTLGLQSEDLLGLAEAIVANPDTDDQTLLTLIQDLETSNVESQPSGQRPEEPQAD